MSTSRRLTLINIRGCRKTCSKQRKRFERQAYYLYRSGWMMYRTVHVNRKRHNNFLLINGDSQSQDTGICLLRETTIFHILIFFCHHNHHLCHTISHSNIKSLVTDNTAPMKSYRKLIRCSNLTSAWKEPSHMIGKRCD